MAKSRAESKLVFKRKKRYNRRIQGYALTKPIKRKDESRTARVNFRPQNSCSARKGWRAATDVPLCVIRNA